MAQHNEALISEDCNLSISHKDELERIVLLMNSLLDWSHASLHDINPQTQLLSALGTLQKKQDVLLGTRIVHREQ
jgi:hypothetical protein